MAQLKQFEKNEISHRAKALKKLEKLIGDWGEANRESFNYK